MTLVLAILGGLTEGVIVDGVCVVADALVGCEMSSLPADAYSSYWRSLLRGGLHATTRRLKGYVAMAGLVMNNEWTACERAEVSVLELSPSQASQLHRYALELGGAGGPQAAGVRALAESAARSLREALRPEQRAVLDAYAENRVTLLIVEGMIDLSDDALPAELPPLEDLKRDLRCLALASRNQVLLNLAGNRAFAYDLDYNEMVRIVGNFKGGGKEKLKNEPLPQDVELSSPTPAWRSARTPSRPTTARCAPPGATPPRPRR